jgi:uncharacterized damage-inducible protein DinB
VSGLAALFVRESAGYWVKTYLPRLERALEALPAGDLWWTPHGGVISMGNILLHLEGNVRQWILSGLGGAPDSRERAGEFSATDSELSGQLLLDRLRDTATQAAALVEALDEQALLAARTIQGFETTGLGAVYHVVEHFSWHTGQAVWIAKARAGVEHGVAFYDEDKVNRARND